MPIHHSSGPTTFFVTEGLEAEAEWPVTDDCPLRLQRGNPYIGLGWGCGLGEFCGPSVTQPAQYSTSKSHVGCFAAASGNFHPRILKMCFLKLLKALFIWYAFITHQLSKPFMNPCMLLHPASSGYLIRPIGLRNQKAHSHVNEYSCLSVPQILS